MIFIFNSQFNVFYIIGLIYSWPIVTLGLFKKIFQYKLPVAVAGSIKYNLTNLYIVKVCKYLLQAWYFGTYLIIVILTSSSYYLPHHSTYLHIIVLTSTS